MSYYSLLIPRMKPLDELWGGVNIQLKDSKSNGAAPICSLYPSAIGARWPGLAQNLPTTWTATWPCHRAESPEPPSRPFLIHARLTMSPFPFCWDTPPPQLDFLRSAINLHRSLISNRTAVPIRTGLTGKGSDAPRRVVL